MLVQVYLCSFPVCVWVSSVARSCATKDANNKDNVWKSSIPAGINCPPPSKTVSHSTRFGTISTRSHRFCVCRCLHRFGNLLHGLDPEGTCDWMLRQPLRDVGIQRIGFRVQQRAKESHPPLVDTPFVAQQSPFLVTDALRFDLLCLLPLHRFDVSLHQAFVVQRISEQVSVARELTFAIRRWNSPFLIG